ncbi:MAG: Gfo/Idh/MocA family oxidoreductase [Deltaproteobacteria bacterium]|nr:Gfo/Idh/MocA family oxidoreductase [Deltaproteobacteria bacterium]
MSPAVAASESPVRFGILGTGTIAAKLAEAFADAPGCELIAVGSRSARSADAFADRWHIPLRHASYEALARDPHVDVVYVATPHALHCENTLMAIAAGKAVLCEKPFAIHAGEARRMVAAARARGVFLMEAMWTRFVPLWADLRARIAGGAIGTPRLLAADFGFRTDYDEGSILFDPAMGGGALLDVGVYPVSLAHMIWGRPEAVAAVAHMTPSGVDDQCAAVLRFADGAIATVSASLSAETHQDLSLSGTLARLRVDRPWWCPEHASLTDADEHVERVHCGYQGNGYTHQLMEVARCVRGGELESATMPLDESVAIMETLDRIRAVIGLRYPMDPPR